jgi:hypothetical protein
MDVSTSESIKALSEIILSRYNLVVSLAGTYSRLKLFLKNVSLRIRSISSKLVLLWVNKPIIDLRT